MVSPALFSSATDEWATPQSLFDQLNARYGFTLDVCATAQNAKCPAYFTREQDGLAQEWTGVVYMNPPYGRVIGHWVKKAYDSARMNGARVVCLLPSRTGTKWFQRYVLPILTGEVPGSVTFLPSRLRFGNAANSAPFDSVIVEFAPWTESREEVA